MDTVTSVGKKLALNFVRNKNAKKKAETRDGCELDIEPMPYRKGSMGNMSPMITLGLPASQLKTGKSSSLGSINSDFVDTPLVDHDDIISLTHDVRGFSDALANLKAVFHEETGMDAVRVAAHEKLGEVLYILKTVLQKYPPLHSTDILTAAAILISKIKSFHYENVNGDADIADLYDSIDQLALAFSSSVSEYLMGDVDAGFPQSTISKSKSYDNLVSNSAASFGGTEEMHPEPRDTGSISTEQLDNMLLKLESGVDLALQRAKLWSKYVKDIMAYAEKRTSLEMEFTKSLAKLAHNVRPIITEHGFLPFQSIYCTAFDQDIEQSNARQAACTLIQTQRFIEPLNAQRLEHDKARKTIKEVWHKELRKMQDAVSNLRKARSLYVTRQQEYEKAKEAASKAEADNPSQSSAGVAKVDKKKRLEEDAMHRAIEAETTYKACVVEANNRQHELEKVKADVLAQIRELINQCDQIMKAVTVGYFQLQHTVSAPIPAQYQALYESSQLYEPGAQYAEYIKRLPVSSTYTNNNPEPFVFEPYTPDSKTYSDRKPSIQSSGSGSSDVQFYAEDSPQPSPRRPRNKPRGGQPIKAWGQGEHHHAGSDTDSISGSSSKSRESSPSASPFSQTRHSLVTSSMNELVEADRDAQIEHRLGSALVNSADRNLNRSFRGAVLSRAAQTHTFRKLRAPSRCRSCESYVYFQGAECEKCGLASHKKCLETLIWECGHRPVQRRMTTFGVDFSAHVQQSKTEIPYLILKCVAEIDYRGICTKGIYRVSGVKSRVETLCQNFETDEGNVELCEHHPNVIANVLKLYLRQLPEPLLTFGLYSEFIQVAKDELSSNGPPPADSPALEKIKAIVDKLPIPNFRTCSFLMHHLKRVTQHEDTNQMSAGNLGIVFGPTLLRPSEGAASLNSLMDTPHQSRVIEMLVEHVQEIFGDDEGVPEELKRQTPVEMLDGATDAKTVNLDAARDSDPCPELSPSDVRWSIPQITENLLDELAKEEPRFHQMSNLSGSMTPPLPGSAEAEEEVNPQPTLTPEPTETELHSDDELPDSLLPDDSPSKESGSPTSSQCKSAKLADPEEQSETSEAKPCTAKETVSSDWVVIDKPPQEEIAAVKTELKEGQTSQIGSVVNPESTHKLMATQMPKLTQPRPYSPPVHRRLKRTTADPSASAVGAPKGQHASRSTFYASSTTHFLTETLEQPQAKEAECQPQDDKDREPKFV